MKFKLEFLKYNKSEIVFKNEQNDIFKWKFSLYKSEVFWNFVLCYNKLKNYGSIKFNDYQEISAFNENFEFPEIPDSYLKTSLIKFLNRS